MAPSWWHAAVVVASVVVVMPPVVSPCSCELRHPQQHVCDADYGECPNDTRCFTSLHPGTARLTVPGRGYGCTHCSARKDDMYDQYTVS
ncbi:hypothetical protein E2C01_098381 [Portunus trituberculatus]|uniref:Secreted protein n=1 Tax=Portunus trituberculatus TaxID=210409 RepID=A0A5B7K889_PORTR|nr:hypothetical protein [Portunus trituberculatus]